MKRLFFCFLFISFPLFGLQIKDVTFDRVFFGALKEEEELFIRSMLYAYRDIPKEVLKTDNIEKRLRYFFAEEPADLNNPTKKIYFIRAEYKNELVGFVSFEQYDSIGIVYIRELAVAPEAMKHGLGRKLVFLCNDYIPDVHKIILATARYNQGAIAFYKRLGFVESFDIPHGLDANLFIGLEYLAQ